MARQPQKYNFDTVYWEEAISKDDWYFEFNDFYKQAARDLGEETEEFSRLKKQIRHFFSDSLNKGIIKLADNGPNLDAARKPIDTIVIHHTSASPGYDLNFLNAVHLLNIYAPYFAKPTIYEERRLKGKAIWSNHSKNEKPVFWAYHWLMRMDGKCERLLDDKCIGWHAGNWDVNRRSVAICLDNDYENICPSEGILQKLAQHIKKNYPKANKIIGHCEANSGTVCPGSHFNEEWKSKVLEYLYV